MPPLNNIAIIGGGLAGSSLALEFSQAGIECTLFETEVVGGAGASAISRGIVRVFDTNPRLMMQSLQGLKQWQYINTLFPGVFVECGCLYLLAPEHYEIAKLHLDQLAAAGYHPQLLTDQASIISCQPLLSDRKLPADQCAIWEPQGGYVNTRLACQLMVNWARQKGSTVLEGVTVSDWKKFDDGIQITTANQVLTYDAAILATGARLNELRQDSDVFCRSIPLSLMYSPDGNSPQQCLIDETIGGYLRPEQGDWFYAGGAEQIDVSHPSQLPMMDEAVFSQNQDIAGTMLGQSGFVQQSTLMGYDGYRRGFEPLVQTCSQLNRLGIFAAFSGRGAKYIPAAAKDFATRTLTQWSLEQPEGVENA